MIDHMISWLGTGDVSDVILAMNHLSEKVKLEVGAKQLQAKLFFSVEETPLGTGGPLRLALPLLGPNDPVVVVNGDVVSNIDLRRMIDFHLSSGAEATAAIVSVMDPRPFGLATVDGKDRIIGFEEKSRKQTEHGWINAGVYILNPTVIHLIPSGRSVSLEREIFPVLAKRMKMMAWRHTGFWYDIGKIPDYIVANRELLAQPDSLSESRQTRNMRTEGVQEPFYIGSDCSIDTSAKLGPFTILSPRVRVRGGSTVSNTIVFEDTTIGEDCVVEDSVIGEAVSVGSGVTIGRGSLIAGEISIADGTEIRPGSVVLN